MNDRLTSQGEVLNKRRGRSVGVARLTLLLALTLTLTPLALTLQSLAAVLVPLSSAILTGGALLSVRPNWKQLAGIATAATALALLFHALLFPTLR